MTSAAPIDRQALVTRHNVVLHRFDAENPLTVGNGHFAFTVDATGLQTFPDAFENTTPLGTLSDWGWHTIPNTNGWSIDTFHFKEFPDLNGRMVPYADVPGNHMTPEIKWLRANPHRLDLGRIGLVLTHTNGLAGRHERFDRHRADTGFVERRNRQPFQIRWPAGGGRNRLRSGAGCHCGARHFAAGATRQLAIQIRFPYGTGETVTADWSQPDAHETIFPAG